MKRIIPTSTVREAHPYTRSKSPWILNEYSSAYGKLIHYLSGGGFSTFGRTVAQEEARIKQRRFLAVFAALVCIWALLWIF